MIKINIIERFIIEDKNRVIKRSMTINKNKMVKRFIHNDKYITWERNKDRQLSLSFIFFVLHFPYIIHDYVAYMIFKICGNSITKSICH